MSTHNISEVAALCQSVYVMFSGRVRFAGTPAELAGLAVGRVWEDDTQDPRAIRSWITATGAFRHLGEPPAGAQVVDPTLDDGYLLPRPPGTPVTPAWLAPTARAVPWQPLAGVAACLMAVCLRGRRHRDGPGASSTSPPPALAAAVVAGLRDPAADLLSRRADLGGPPPRPARALLVPAGRGAVAGLPPGRTSWRPAGWPVGPAVALIATGLAVVAWAPERFAVEAGVAAPLLWVALARAGAVSTSSTRRWCSHSSTTRGS